MGILYIFVDDAGDYDFKPQKTKYLIWGATTMVDNPHALYTPLSQLKDELNTNGVDIDRFHASEDGQWIRDKVFKILTKPEIVFENDFVITEKRKANPSIRDVRILYPKMASYLLRYISNRYRAVDKIIIFTDTLPRKKREAIEKALKANIRRFLHNKEFHIYHHSSRSNFGIQAIDYCAWAVFRKWERNDLRSYHLIQTKNMSEFDIFQSGTTVYY